jgi:hypothetical protein
MLIEVEKVTTSLNKLPNVRPCKILPFAFWNDSWTMNYIPTTTATTMDTTLTMPPALTMRLMEARYSSHRSQQMISAQELVKGDNEQENKVKDETNDNTDTSSRSMVTPHR